MQKLIDELKEKLSGDDAIDKIFAALEYIFKAIKKVFAAYANGVETEEVAND